MIRNVLISAAAGFACGFIACAVGSQPETLEGALVFGIVSGACGVLAVRLFGTKEV